MKKSILMTTILLTSTAATSPIDPVSQSSGMTEKNAALLTERLEGKTAGKAQKCVQQSRVGQPVIYGNRTIVYSGFGGTEYLNKLPARCPGLDDDDLIVTRRSGAQLCKGGPIEPIDRFSKISGPICRLGAFIPYTKPKN